MTNRMKSRGDIKQYYQSAEQLDNVLLFSQGGAYVRPGLGFMEVLPGVLSEVDLNGGGVTVTAPGGGTAANAIDDDRTTFVISGAISTTDPFVIAHVDLGSAVEITFADVYDLSLSGASTDEFKWQYSTDDITFVDFDDDLHGLGTTIRDKRSTGLQTARYWRLAKIGGEDLTTDTVSFSEIKLWSETSTVSNSEDIEFDFGGGQTYLLVMTDYNLRVFLAGVSVADIPIPYSNADLPEVNYTQNSDTLILFHEDYENQRIVRGSLHTTWDLTPVIYTVIPKFAFFPVSENPAGSITPSANSGTITLTASSAVLLATDVGGYVTGNGGRARITSFTSTTVVEARVLINFIDTSAISSGNWTIERGYEDVWSTSRGWPRAGVFHQRRLAVGGSFSVPNGLWMSKSSDFFNFDEGAGLDDEAIATLVSSDQVNVVKHLVSADRLEIFTSDSEFYVGGNPITPENVTVKRQDKRGIGNIAPVFVDGASLFVQVNADIVREFVFDAISDKYNANGISIISENLIKTPVDMAHSRPFGDQDADLVYVVNSDGSWSVLNSLRQQELTGWVSGSDPFGSLEGVGYDAGYMYASCNVTVNSIDKKYLCRFDATRRLDYSLYLTNGSPQTAWSGIDHLEGEEVHVIADGVLLEGTFTVTSGAITITPAALTVEIGLSYLPSIVMNPPERELQDGTMIGEIRRVIKTNLILKDSLGVVVNGRDIPFRRFGQDIFDGPLEPFTGIKTTRNLGYSKEPRDTITQSGPLPFELLGVIREVRA